MNASEYIVSKQIQWAKNSGIKLIGRKNPADVKHIP